jgi:AbrB family looped-hinge helix DNA binding protein
MTSEGRSYNLPLGTYKRTLDRRLRMIVPAIWREPPMFKSDSGHIIFRRPYRLVLLPDDFVRRITKEKFKGMTKREKDAIRGILTTLHPVKLDGRGRITIPRDLSRALGLAPGDIMIVTASGEWIEIWPSKDWERGRGHHILFNE